MDPKEQAYEDLKAEVLKAQEEDPMSLVMYEDGLLVYELYVDTDHNLKASIVSTFERPIALAVTSRANGTLKRCSISPLQVADDES